LQRLVLERHTYEQRVNQFLTAVERNIEAPAVGLRIAPPTWKQAPRWGDTHFARDLADALRRRGMRVGIAVRGEWDANEHQGVDIAIHLRGIRPYSVKPGHINMLWIISHPDDVDPEECDRFDVVAAAGATLAANLAAKTDKDVAVLPQATNPARFHPGPPDPALAAEVLFVGNSRGHERPMVNWAIEAGLDLSVYGMGWDGTKVAPYVRSEHLPNESVPNAYRSARVVLNDHWPDMAAQGIVSNRILDALACGAVVVSDMALGLSDVIGDAVAIATSPETLVDAVDAIGRERAAFEARAATGSQRVHAEHTFDKRADQIIDLLRPMLEAWGGIPGGAPEWWRLDEAPDD
jgi:glycosyltransferase involved in cell wall biosynthesis